jgi:hypothetical protein
MRNETQRRMQVWIWWFATLALSLLEQQHRPIPCRLVTEVRHLKVSEAEVTVTRLSASD